MTRLRITSSHALHGRVSLPGDKSISHRAVLLGALAEGTSRVENFLPAADCQATVRCLRALGVEIETLAPTTLAVHGRGLHGLSPAGAPLDCGGSGTTMRLLAGILAGQPFRSVLTGNDSLRRRPMDRIALPLRVMGAHVETTEGRPPLEITGGPLCPIDYTLPVASAQVKSAILLAGLYARGPTTVREPALSRDHTERMLQAMGAHLTVDGLAVTLHPGSPLHARDTVIPGDISSAAFLLAAALLLPGSEVVLEGVGVNPTRTGILDVLGGMGAEVVLENPREVGGEPVADLTVRRSRLRATHIGGPLIPRLIDELPLIALVATQAEGVTVVQDAAELRVKESDRIATTVAELRKLGADIEARPDGFVIRGPTPLRGAEVESHGDHRLAMTLTVAGLIARGETVVQDTECIGDSFPGFEETLSYLGARLEREGDIDRG